MDIAEFLNLTPQQRHNLKTLDLPYKRIGNLESDRLQAFCAALSQCTSLNSLDLKGNLLNNIDYEGWVYFSNALSNLKSLEHLLLFNNSLGDIDNQSCNALSVAISQCTALQTLDLDDNNLNALEMDGLKEIFNAISALPCLVHLSLSYNNLEQLENDRLIEIFEELSKCTYLEFLGLSGNGFGHLENQTSNALGATLSKFTRLRTLALDNNDLVNTVQSLDLDTNELDESRIDGLKAIFEAIPKLHNLVNLSLCNNNLGLIENNSFPAICQALSQCTSLRNLRLNGNHLDVGVNGGGSYENSSKEFLKYFVGNFKIKNRPIINVEGISHSWARVLYHQIPSLVLIKSLDANIENKLAVKNRLLMRRCFASNIQMLINNGLNAGIAAKILTYLFPWFENIIEELTNKDINFVSDSDFKNLDGKQRKMCIRYFEIYAKRTLNQVKNDVYIDGKLQTQNKINTALKNLKI